MGAQVSSWLRSDVLRQIPTCTALPHSYTPMVLLKEPLYVFSIPQSIVESLAARETPRILQFDTGAAPAQPEPLRDASSISMACALCLGAIFADVNEQRNHFRSDWHRYNAKMRIQDPNGLSLTESQFTSHVEGELDDAHRSQFNVPNCILFH